MATGEYDNDVDGDGATGNEVYDDGAGATCDNIDNNNNYGDDDNDGDGNDTIGCGATMNRAAAQ
jgi:hypothetical protein